MVQGGFSVQKPNYCKGGMRLGVTGISTTLKGIGMGVRVGYI